MKNPSGDLCDMERVNIKKSINICVCVYVCLYQKILKILQLKVRNHRKFIELNYDVIGSITLCNNRALKL